MNIDYGWLSEKGKKSTMSLIEGIEKVPSKNGVPPGMQRSIGSANPGRLSCLFRKLFI